MSATNDGERGEIEDLLPWHAAGTLDRGEMERVEAALATDPELSRRYDRVREELAQTIQLNEALGAPSSRALEALFAKIDAEPARAGAASLNLGRSGPRGARVCGHLS
jgi:anti-sigma factor RsiW